MKCQFFPFLGVFFALAYAPGLTSVHAAGETALDNGMYKVTIGREIKMPCGCDVGSCRGEKHLWFPPALKPSTAT